MIQLKLPMIEHIWRLVASVRIAIARRDQFCNRTDETSSIRTVSEKKVVLVSEVSFRKLPRMSLYK